MTIAIILQVFRVVVVPVPVCPPQEFQAASPVAHPAVVFQPAHPVESSRHYSGLLRSEWLLWLLYQLM